MTGTVYYGSNIRTPTYSDNVLSVYEITGESNFLSFPYIGTFQDIDMYIVGPGYTDKSAETGGGGAGQIFHLGKGMLSGNQPWAVTFDSTATSVALGSYGSFTAEMGLGPNGEIGRGGAGNMNQSGTGTFYSHYKFNTTQSQVEINDVSDAGDGGLPGKPGVGYGAGGSFTDPKNRYRNDTGGGAGGFDLLKKLNIDKNSEIGRKFKNFGPAVILIVRNY
jgi:hypothetical protein